MAWLFMMFFTLIIALGGTQNQFLTSYRANLFWENRYVSFQNIAELNAYYLSSGELGSDSDPALWVAKRNAEEYKDFQSASFDMDDGEIKFRRSVFFAPRGDKFVTVNSLDVLSSNSCGVGAANQSVTWCGDKKILWFKYDSRDFLNNQYSSIRADLDQTLAKLIKTFHGSRFQLDTLPVGQVTYLSSFGNTAQQLAATCVGEVLIAGVPLNCRDLYSYNSHPIGIFFEKANRIILFVDSGVRRSDGSPVFLGQDIIL
ncbi:hypothetical protein ACM3N2_17955 [Aeromonas hydrophila]|uniref:hypothetical protein n=1 Tax=Aeromonas hydrophila TaxID=644 RepID=UPI0039F7368A